MPNNKSLGGGSRTTQATYQFMDAGGKSVEDVKFLPTKTQAKRDHVRKYLAKITDIPRAICGTARAG
ncbi:MAG: hypothetical protein ACREC9_01965 [Methylocella sp.]